uniref:DUF1534 domain-containing protein n=1 Tax=Parastrongyloides trichosuri TaxID=131310 RepID=A0A0N4ZEE3_PARTI
MPADSGTRLHRSGLWQLWLGADHRTRLCARRLGPGFAAARAVRHAGRSSGAAITCGQRIARFPPSGWRTAVSG